MAKENADGQEKTEDASSRRLTDARDKGQVAKSIEVTTAAMLLFGGWVVYTFGESIAKDMHKFMSYVLRHATEFQITETSIPEYFLKLIIFSAGIILPVIGLLMIIGVAAEIAQVGFHFAGKKFTEGLNIQSIVNPFSGLKRILFSKNSLMELFKNFGKLTIVSLVVYHVLSGKIDTVFALIDMPLSQMSAFIAATGFEMFLKVASVYALIAAADYFFQKRKFRDEMKMTKTEVKEDTKQTEGDVQVKQRIRAIARQRLRKVMMSRVKEADVIITNPTHYAVAIKYKQGDMSAPVVVAKGLDFLALKIREKAKEHNVPLVEDPPLARALYSACDIDQSIPENMFKAVAQILAYVYRLKNATK